MATGPALRGALTAAIALLSLAGCSRRVTRTLVPAEQASTLDHKSPYLKAHLRTGYVYVLGTWSVESGNVIYGTGRLLNASRGLVSSGEFRFPSDSVALFETNVVRASGPSKAMTVMAGITAAVAAICATNPKTCFGSCPTFYAPDSSGSSLQAEGFSSSIAPALEATDLDMLYAARPRGPEFTLRVTNEALETHVIRWADLLVLPRPAGGRVFVTPQGNFRGATSLQPPSRCTAAEGDCLAAMRSFDRTERWSSADSTDLAARETIDLVFDNPSSAEVGLVISSRQTLMTTYLIYQALAYMGTEATAILGSFETGGAAARERAGGLGRALGRIDVLVPDSSGEWMLAGSVGETGPIATDTKMVPLRATAGQPLRVRLRLTRGLWRIEQVALAVLGSVVEPLRVPPRQVRRDGRDEPSALHGLVARTAPLTTLPGDEYELSYRLPLNGEDQEIFLESRGYYLEWMRQEWMAEENLMMAARLALDPDGMLRELAPAYRLQEASMDQVFWNSKYVRP